MLTLSSKKFFVQIDGHGDKVYSAELSELGVPPGVSPIERFCFSDPRFTDEGLYMDGRKYSLECTRHSNDGESIEQWNLRASNGSQFLYMTLFNT